MNSVFKHKVISIVRIIPCGKVASYGQVAVYAGSPRAAREVGSILKHAKEDIPWWRVVNNTGRISISGNFEADKNLQRKLLSAENILISDDFTFDIENYRWRMSEEDIKIL